MTISLRKTNLKRIAWLLLVIFTLQYIYPLGAFALTSGPVQPESQAFQKAGTSDMVDLFSGDMKYNIPLFDIDGYPVNLNYNSGIGMDDEASWVGLGWNLNVGAINRQLRGLPDDFAGDTTTVTHYTKPKITIGGRVTVKGEIAGIAAINGSFSLGVFSDNYTGIGAEIGVNAGLSYSFSGDNPLTAGLGLGVLSSTASGVDVSPQISLSISAKSTENLTVRSGLSATLGYNTRAGLKDLTLGSSFSMSANKTEKYYEKNDAGVYYAKYRDVNVGKGSFSTNQSFITYNTEAISPKVNIPYVSKYDSYSFDIGLAKTVAFTGGGGTGYRSVRRVINEVNHNQSFGYLYSERAKNQKNVVLDFIREQDNPVIPELPNLAFPVHTPDLFNYSGQVGSGQFRLYRGGTGIYFDNEATDLSEVSTTGFDVGAGAYFHGGVTDFELDAKSTSRKWRNQNFYQNIGDFQDNNMNEPNREHVAFRLVGERIANDKVRDQKIQDNTPIAVKLDGNETSTSFMGGNQVFPSNGKIEKGHRTPTVNSVSYLTAEEAAKAGRDRKIQNYPFHSTSFAPANNHEIDTNTIGKINRTSAYRKNHHLSEITVTDQQGSRSVYGLPVYNITQQEYTFAIGSTYKTFDRNQTEANVNGLRPDHKRGIDHYYHKEEQPAYASSFLLTQVLSADYIDRGKPGISEEDAGSAIKFNYSKVEQDYQWRTPYPSKTTQVGGNYVNGQQNANVNKGLLADPDDDKASIIYGKKELWYLSSIESKTKIAYFITEDRLDALGVNSWGGYAFSNGARQKRLVEIRLYSKNNISKPIKVVKLSHSYALCHNTPNSMGTGLENNSNSNLTPSNVAGGKLTLNKVWFEYGNSDKGKHHPYIFHYNKDGYVDSSQGTNPAPISYRSMSTDRWGSFKGNNRGDFVGLGNDEFPYAEQHDLDKANKNAALWNLSVIELPSGGKISIDYEADDYAYVQNKKAMHMVPFETFNTGSDSDLTGAKGIKLTIDVSGAPSEASRQTQWFRDTYLNGSEYLYTKFFVRMANDQNPGGANDKDFIATYCKVKKVSLNGNAATVTFDDVSDGGVTDNPIRFAAWQNTKQNYPRYAYPGFKNRVDDNSIGGAIGGVVSAIVNASRNLSELKENFYQKAKRKQWNKEVVKNKSFVRLVKMDGKKLGGGLRVKKIRIEDQWTAMAGASAPDGAYGQSYDYTTENAGKIISSGVATYEPSIGNDENPIKLAVNYSQKIKGALSNFFSLEQPFGESLFPAPSVGYSKVTVRDLNASGAVDATQRTGYTVSEFYTAREFPVKVIATSLQKNDRPLSKYFSLTKSDSRHENILSQGYYIELNDMHGKAKANLTYNQSDALISSSRYYYNTEEIAPGEMRLRNRVNVIKDGQVEEATIGRDLEFYTDFREHESSNIGRTYNIGLDIFPVIIWPFFILPHGIPRKSNNDYKLFRSACAVKVAHYYGVLDKVEQMENGSTISQENMAYDADTGEPVVTRTQNEFKKYIYKVNFPAHWAYSGMSGAYQNAGALIKGLQKQGDKLNSPFNEFLHGGDELLNLDNGSLYWVIDDGYGDKNLVDKQGYVQSNINQKHVFKVIRSGHRNQLSAMASSLTCLENPIVGNRLVLNDLSNRSLKVLNANAQTFSEDWYPERVPIKMDTSYIDTVTHVWAKIDIDDYQTSYGPSECAEEIKGKYMLRFYKASSSVTPPIFTPNNLINYSGEVLLADYVSNSSSLPPVFNTYSAYYVYYIDIPNASQYNFQSANGSNSYSLLSQINCGWLQTSKSYKTHFYQNEQDIIYVGLLNHGTIPVYSQQPINPYLLGYRGNWRPYASSALKVQRENFNLLSSKGANVEKAGYVKDFIFPWYLSENPLPKWVENFYEPWETVNIASVYDRYGQELENKDATSNMFGIKALGLTYAEGGNPNTFGRYQAASFDFNGQLPSVVASNAMQREIYSNSFEDLFFRSNHFDDKKNNVGFKNATVPLVMLLNNQEAHTGNYSLNLPVNGITLKTFAHYRPEGFTPLIGQNIKKEYIITDDKYFWGFEPMPRKKYLFTIWVKDGQNTPNKNIPIDLLLGGNAVDLKCVAVVEKWKKIQGIIDLSTYNALQTVTLDLVPKTTNVKIDDLRIHPVDSHMKTYAYDDKNYRLMAELDENAFASFYEYDNEGALVRVKKETERGIVTLKESRSSYKKKTP